MLFRLFMVIATLAFTSNIYAQSMLVGDRIAVFYPADFDSTKTLPSLALKVELQKTADRKRQRQKIVSVSPLGNGCKS
jgi:hypothetical protein